MAERLYNRYLLAVYAVAIVVVIYSVEPESGIFDLLVGTGFMIIWTFAVGMVACFAVFIPLAMAFKKEKYLAFIFPWLPPLIGYSVFLWVIHEEF